MIIAIDPGIRGTGIAVFSAGELYPTRTRLLLPNFDKPWVDRMVEICTELEDIIHQHKIKIAMIEQPTFMRSKHGLATAANGSLVKLAMLAGALLWVCAGVGVDCDTVLPVVWKGKRPKEDTQKTIYKLLPDMAPHLNHNVMDAIGIGLYYKGAMKGGRIVR